LDQDDWQASFYVLTNVGLLVFESDNFLNPTKLIPLAQIAIEPFKKKVGSKQYVFKFKVGPEENLLAAPDKTAYDGWMAALGDCLKAMQSNKAKDTLISRMV